MRTWSSGITPISLLPAPARLCDSRARPLWPRRAAGSPVPAPPFPRAFAIDVASPRSLVFFEETTVPLVLVNTGTDTWDPARVHLSYHWLWLVPRELASPLADRAVPGRHPHDLGAAVPPGGRVTVERRLLAPSMPGVYWLQWDMVEEGVTWFVAGLAAPAAPSGLRPADRRRIRSRRCRSWSRSAVCSCSDASRAAGGSARRWRVRRERRRRLVRDDARREAVPARVPRRAARADAGRVLADGRDGRRCRCSCCCGCCRGACACGSSSSPGAFGTLLMMADVVYYRFFGDILSAPALLGAHQTGHVADSIRSLLAPASCGPPPICRSRCGSSSA